MLSRSDPGLRLGRLRVEARLADMRAPELAFTLAETAAVLAVSNITLSDDTLQELFRLTERVAGRGCAGRPVAGPATGPVRGQGFVHRLSGSDWFIADYLSEEVLGGQEPELRDFSWTCRSSTASTPRWPTRRRRSAPRPHCCIGSSGTTRSWSPCRRRGGIAFITCSLPTPKQRSRWSIPERVVELHRRGARWLASHDHPEDAIGHLLAAGDTDEAAQLIQRHWVRYRRRRPIRDRDGWLQALRGTPADHGAAATITGAWMAALTGDSPEIRRRLTALEDMTTPTALPDGTMSPRSGLLMIRGLVGSTAPTGCSSTPRTRSRSRTTRPAPGMPWRGPVWVRPHSSPATFGWHDTTSARPPQPRSPRDRSASSPTPSSRCARLSKATVQPAGVTLSWQWPSSPTTRCRPTRTFCPHTPRTAPPWPPGAAYPPRSTPEAGLRPSRRAPGLSPWPLIHHLIVMAGLAARMGDPEDESTCCWPESTPSPRGPAPR